MKNLRIMIVAALAMWPAAMAIGEVQVAVDHNQNDGATAEFKFKNIPSPVADNAAARATFTVIAGKAADDSGGTAVLNDGKLPQGEDEPANNFFFEAGSAGGRVQVDLGSVMAIKAVNTYSWHPNTRGPQVYKLYASDGTSDKFNAKPGAGTNPEQTGWQFVASVDTRPNVGDGGGQYGVSIADSTGLGKYRYLLFDMSKTESDDDFGNTFYSEINVIGADNGGSATAGSPPAGGVAAQVSLAPYFNNVGIYVDGMEFSGGLDDGGWACSSNLLGQAQVWNGVTFSLGSASPTNVLTCAGQTISLPAGNYSSLKMLATAVNGDQESQKFTVACAGGDSQTVTQSISDWFTPENFSGESQAVNMSYRNQSDGTKDERAFYIYGYALTLNKTNAVKSLKLPDNANVKVFALTLVP
jgi:hypothetical protein